jgi:quercetin dioxygenase-like cupin family protein
MGKYILRIFHDRYAPGTSAELPACTRVTYCVSGSAEITSDKQAALAADQACHTSSPALVKVGAGDTLLWRWEFVRVENVFDGKIRLDGVESRNAGVYTLEMDPNFPRMIRCDRVNFPPGGIAYHHIHAGPGVRSLLTGSLYLDSGGRQWQGTPGSTWIEHGPEEVLARADDDLPSSFVRVMIIPRDYQGKSTITYVRPEEADLPRVQTYDRYLDEFIDI